MLGVEGTDRGELDLVVASEHRGVVSEVGGRDLSDREDRDSDHATGFDAHVWLHRRRVRLPEKLKWRSVKWLAVATRSRWF